MISAFWASISSSMRALWLTTTFLYSWFLELHRLVDIHVVVADGLHVDLAAGQESLDVLKHRNNQTTLGAALHVAGDDFLVVVGLVHAVPRLEDAGFLVAEHQLAVGVLLALDIDLNLVASLQVGIVANLADGDDAVALGTDVDDHLAVGDGHDGTLDDFLLGKSIEALLIGVVLLARFLLFDFTSLLVDGIPVEVGQRLYVLVVHLLLFVVFVCPACTVQHH